MAKLNTETFIKTEYGAFGKKADGTWKNLKPSSGFTKKESAEATIEAQISFAKQHPKLFDNFVEYEIRQRTVITTYEEWSKAE